MIKVTIKGEVYSFDEQAYPMDEAIALEEGLGMSYGRYQEALTQGSAKAIAGLAWCVLRRAGRDISLASLMSGEFSTADIQAAPEGGEADPTDPGPSSAPTTGGGSAGSRTPSATRPRKSGT